MLFPMERPKQDCATTDQLTYVHIGKEVWNKTLLTLWWGPHTALSPDTLIKGTLCPVIASEM